MVHTVSLLGSSLYNLLQAHFFYVILQLILL